MIDKNAKLNFVKANTKLNDDLTIYQTSLLEFATLITENCEYDALLSAGLRFDEIVTFINRLKNETEKVGTFLKYLEEFKEDDVIDISADRSKNK